MHQSVRVSSKSKPGGGSVELQRSGNSQQASPLLSGPNGKTHPVLAYPLNFMDSYMQ